MAQGPPRLFRKFSRSRAPYAVRERSEDRACSAFTNGTRKRGERWEGERCELRMAEVMLNAKVIRQAHARIEQIQTKLYQLAALLHRIYYKSKAQHRRAKWFQSISGMRKCFSRLLEMQSVKSKIDESLPDRGVSAKSRSRREELGLDGGERASIDVLQRAIGQVWSSLWADTKAQDGR